MCISQSAAVAALCSFDLHKNLSAVLKHVPKAVKWKMADILFADI
jgi:hypothetical protein